ncbi:leucine-rich repeat domain-containing protein, partial [Gemelliphila asaccharolytica]
MKRIMRFFLALVMFMSYLPLNPITSYANDDVANGNVNDGVKIDDVFSDENFKKYVSDNFDKNKNGYLSDDEVADVTELSIGKQGISSLNGIGFFKNLTKLDCSENEIESLDLSNNTKLFFLDCSINKLNRLDVSNNRDLTTLYCHTNQLTNLDVSENTNLTKLICNGNNLTNLFVGYNIDLTELNCNNNKLKNLYVGRNENLTNLWCAYNELESLYLGYNKNLTKLGCDNNKLESLDVSEIPNLTSLYCSGNKLTSLDLSKNKNLTKLECSNQQYNISINKDTREFKYSKFPGKFNKDKVTSPAGASFGNDALTVDSNNPSEVTYNYKVAEGKEMNVKLNVTYKDVVKTSTDPKVQVTEGYTRVTFDA